MQIPGISTAGNEKELELPGATELHNRFAGLIRPGGGFPVSYEMVRAITEMSEQDSMSMQAVAPLVAWDPVFTIRLMVAASERSEGRGALILSVEDALARLGTRGLLDFVDDFGDARPYSTAFYGRGVALAAYQQVIMTGILAERLFSALSENQQTQGRASALTMAGGLSAALLAYARPQYFASCFVTGNSGDRTLVERELKKLFDRSVTEESTLILASLGLSEEFSNPIEMLQVAPWNRKSWSVSGKDGMHELLMAGYLANRLSYELLRFQGKEPLEKFIRDLESRAGIARGCCFSALGGLRGMLTSILRNLGLAALRLPPYLDAMGSEGGMVGAGTVPDDIHDEVILTERMNPFLYELRACFKTTPERGELHRFPQVVLSTLYSLVRGLNFDRAVFFDYEQTRRVLTPLVVLGKPVNAIDALSRSVRSTGTEHMPDVQAALQRRPIFHGDPLIEEDWPFVAFPAMVGDQLLGVFYADKTGKYADGALSTDEQLAAIAIAEEWHDVPPDFL